MNGLIKIRAGYGVRLLSVLCALVLLLTSAPALALSEEELNSIYRDSVHFDKTNTGNGCSLDSSGTALQGNDNIEKAWGFLRGKNFTDEQTAGLVGNFMWESGGGTTINPSAENEIGAYGIAQWLGGRKSALQTYANESSRPVSDLGLQLDFVWREMQGSEGAAYQDIKAVKGTGAEAVARAAQVVMDKYERPGPDGTLDERQTAAKDAYSIYAGSAAAATTTTGVSGGCTGWTGENTQFVDGFTVYDQCDPKWGNNPYGHGTTTICNSGCGPTAMAMIITNLTGKSVTPDVTSKYADTINMYIPGVGSSHSVGPRLAEHWDLSSKKLNNSVSEINAALANGSLVIVAGDGADPFTSAGHFIVIRAVTSEGKWRVGDSAHSDTSAKDWDPEQITAGIRGHESSVYAIYK